MDSDIRLLALIKCVFVYFPGERLETREWERRDVGWRVYYRGTVARESSAILLYIYGLDCSFYGIFFFQHISSHCLSFPLLLLCNASVWVWGGWGLPLGWGPGYVCPVVAGAPCPGWWPSLPVAGLNARWGQSLTSHNLILTMFTDTLICYLPFML